MALVSSSHEIVHIENHCTSIAAFQRERALAARILLASKIGQFHCRSGTERHLRPDTGPPWSTPRIPSFGVVAAKGTGRPVGKKLFSALSKSLLYQPNFSFQPWFRRTPLLCYQIQDRFSNRFSLGFDSLLCMLRFRVS